MKPTVIGLGVCASPHSGRLNSSVLAPTTLVAPASTRRREISLVMMVSPTMHESVAVAPHWPQFDRPGPMPSTAYSSISDLGPRVREQTFAASACVRQPRVKQAAQLFMSARLLLLLSSKPGTRGAVCLS